MNAICEYLVPEDGPLTVAADPEHIVKSVGNAHDPHDRVIWLRDGRLWVLPRDEWRGRRVALDLTFKGGRPCFAHLFEGCDRLTDVFCLDSAVNQGNFGWMFSGCARLSHVCSFCTEGGTDFTAMFDGCKSLRRAPNIRTGDGVDFAWMFNGCESLEEPPYYDFGKGMNFEWAFDGCDALADAPKLSPRREAVQDG